jgi:hypothetical protein
MGIMESMNNERLGIPQKHTRRDAEAYAVRPEAVAYDIEPTEVQEITRTREEVAEQLSITSRSIGTRSGQVLPFSETRRFVILQNLGSLSVVYIGNSQAVTSSTGFKLTAEPLRIDTSAAIYAISDEVEEDNLRVIEVFG